MAERSPTNLKIYFGPLHLGTFRLNLRVVDGSALPGDAMHEADAADITSLGPEEQGYFLATARRDRALPLCRTTCSAIIYAPRQFEHCFIDLTVGHDAYMARFSSKTRGTLLRKVRKFFELPGGAEFRAYRSPAELRAFHAAARSVSVQTYQERLYHAGIPGSEEFVRRMLRLGEADSARGYILFQAGEPVSYLYCPAEDGRLIYAFLGFDPAQAKHSPGTVLQMLALQEIFRESKFKLFDFTTGDGEHKRLFSTNSVPAADIYVLRRTPAMRAVVSAHRGLDRLGGASVGLAERLGVKAQLRKFLRRQAGGP